MKRWTHTCHDCGRERVVSGAQASRIRNGQRSGLCYPCSVTARVVSPLKRFDRYVLGDVSGCWLWTGAINANGYGLFSFQRRRGHSSLAHLWRWEHEHGPVPEGLELDHLCRNKACVNPAHLEPVTHRENMQRAHPLRPTCPNGHSLTPTNSYVHPHKGRTPRCRTCRNEGMRQARATRSLIQVEAA